MTEKTRAALFGLASMLLLLIGASTAIAEEKTFSMAAPTEYTNGDPLAVEEIESTAVLCGAVDGGPWSPVATAQGFAGEIAADFGDGNYYCVATVTANGLESAPSNQVFFTVQRTPNPPAGFSVD